MTLLEPNKPVKRQEWKGRDRNSCVRGSRRGGHCAAACPGEQQRMESLLLGAPGDVIRPGRSMVLVSELLHHLPRPVHLLKIVLEDVLFAELLQEGPPLPQFVILLAGTFKKLEGKSALEGHPTQDTTGQTGWRGIMTAGIGAEWPKTRSSGVAQSRESCLPFQRPWVRVPVTQRQQETVLTEEILVWLAIMSPLTRWAEGR